MMAEIGVKYLYYAIQTLHNACPAKGYTAHVLGYTLHSILHVLAQVCLLASGPCRLCLLRCTLITICAHHLGFGSASVNTIWDFDHHVNTIWDFEHHLG